MCSQGGGVAIYGVGQPTTATFTNCKIFDNTATAVRLGPSHSMAPMEAGSRK